MFIHRNKPLGMDLDQRFFSTNHTLISVTVSIFHLMIYIYTVQMDGVFFRVCCIEHLPDG